MKSLVKVFSFLIIFIYVFGLFFSFASAKETGDNIKLADGLLLADGIIDDVDPGKEADDIEPEIKPGNVTIDIREGDVKDVLSILATKMDKNIIYIEEEMEITISLQDMALMEALDLLVQKIGFEYIKEDNIIVVGSSERLKEDFFSRMKLTRFDLSYIEASKLEELINDMGVPVETITVEDNDKMLWVQGTSFELVKASELMSMLDIAENEEYIEEEIVPITTARGENAWNELVAVRQLLADMTDVSVGEMHISQNISGDEEDPHHVLWADKPAEKINYLRNLVESFEE